ncbi:MAG TPA: glycosyltransferase [Blastocatellia bacterium]|nr:glycosyltransferase [Blastocatellia bacterium]
MPEAVGKLGRGVSVVIPSWDGMGLLKRFLPSVIAAARYYIEQHEAPVEIIIVNDASSDATVEYLLGEGFKTGPQASQPGEEDGRTLGPALRLISNERNIGFGKSVNRGFEAASYPLVFLLNNDVEVSRDCIGPLVANFADPAVFAAHCRVFEFENGAEVGTGKIAGFSRGFIRVHRSYVPKRSVESYAKESSSMKPLISAFATGGSAMFDRQKFLDIGAFDELLSPMYWEDVEVSYRAWKRGYVVMYEPRSVVHHRISSTMRRANKRKLWRLKQRNRLIYHWVNLHDPGLLVAHLLWVAVLALTAPLRLQPGFILALAAALKRAAAVRRRRREEMLAAKRSDRDVFALFESFSARDDILVYDDRGELERLRQQPGAD